MYEVEENGDGTFDVRGDGRSLAYDVDDLIEAAQVVRRNGGNSYVLIEIDGYRTTVPC